MKTADFDFDLPRELIALRPAARRDCSRLLVLQRDGSISHNNFYDIAEYLNRGDLLLINDTKVLQARLIGSKPSGGKIDIVLVKEDSGGTWEILCKGSYEGIVHLGGGIRAELYYENESAVATGKRCLRFLDRRPMHELLELCGSMPLPPYIKRLPDDEDRVRYQTVYAEKPGSIAAPTAGLHFTDSILKGLSDKGVKLRRLTLHVGAGTFMPIKAERLNEHSMHAEYFEIEASLPGEISQTKASGHRVITVGTTATRAIEGVLSGKYRAAGNGDGIIRGYTDIFIYPGFEFKAADLVLTNFHLPRSTPLMLASAFCGFQRLMNAYKEAISMGYRFFSYGDAMLIL